MQRIAIVRIHGNMKVRQEINGTLSLMRLYRKNTCIVVPNTPAYVGMLMKVKDFVTWGEISPATFRKMLEKRGKLPGKMPLTEDYMRDKLKMTFDKFVEEFFAFRMEMKDIPGLKHFFKLNPPRQGFERKGVRRPFSLGGALGYRKEKINDLLERMI